MNILVIQGPNLNLIGVKSAQVGKRITLDKINKAIRLKIRNRDVVLKILQTHKIEKVLTLLQRNRNWADGVLIAPMGWAQFDYTLKETLSLINLPTVEIYFDEAFFMGTSAEDSILKEVCIRSVTDHPEKVFVRALEVLIRHLRANS